MTGVALRENLARLAQNVGDECKSLRLLINGNDDDLSHLATSDKTSLVAAINELKSGMGQGLGAVIDDARTRTNYTWSSSKITTYLTQQITTAQNQIIAGAPLGLNNLEKVAAALGGRTDLWAYLNAGLAARVRTDTADQGLTSTERQNARKNIGAASQSDLGQEQDYVAIFRDGLL